VSFYLKTDRRVDVDNLTKLVMDVGNRRIWADDSQVSDVRVQKFTHAAVPRTEISVFLQEDV
jgi:Holliday junction resolvase RusA-like endonuclease